MRYTVKVAVAKEYIFDIEADTAHKAIEEAEFLAEQDGGIVSTEMPDHCVGYSESVPRGEVIHVEGGG